MDKIQKLILEAYSKVSERTEGTKKLKELPDAFVKALSKKYGEVDMENDFVSPNLDTYYKHTSTNKKTGSIDHKIYELPSFYKLYGEFESIISDIKTLMGNEDVRNDQAARELFELIKTNFRKLQSYLRKERPDQYAIIRGRAELKELHESFLKTASLINESLIDELEDKPEPEEEPDTDAPKETVLEDATDKILGKFPTLKAAITKLQTEDFKEFVDSIDWISPRPTSFRINLKNGQDYVLKWTGKSFQAQILGKRYLLSNIADYQQALDKLAILYKEAPLKGAGEGEGGETGDEFTGGGGGDFPGEEGGATGGEDDFAADDTGGGDEGGGEDLSGEPIDFEDTAEEPEA